MVDNIGAVDRRIDCRETLQRFNRGLDEEGHEAQTHAVVSLLEKVLVLRTKRHDFGHVDLIEGRQHRHVRLSLDQTLGNLRTQTGHRHSLLCAITAGCNRSSSSTGSRLASSRSGLLGFDSGNQVFFSDATVFTSTLDAVWVNAVFLCQLAGSRREDGIISAGCRCRSCRGCRSGGFSRRRRGGSRSCSTCVELAKQLTAEHGVPFVFNDFAQHAIRFCQHFHDNLVGLDVDNEFVTLYRIARLLVPGRNGAVSNRFRKLRGFDLDSH